MTNQLRARRRLNPKLAPKLYNPCTELVTQPNQARDKAANPEHVKNDHGLAFTHSQTDDM
jgi:hypothetical protein